MKSDADSPQLGTPRRVPVSLRVPADLAGEVDAFAQEHGVRKTDAYLYLIKRGLQSEDDAAPMAAKEALRASEYRALLDDLSALLRPPVSAAREAQRAREAVAGAARRFPAIERAWLFGSFARGTQTPQSDIDVRLEIDRRRKFTLRDLGHFAKLVQQETSRECDVVSASDLKNETLADAIEKEKVLVYEREAD